MRPSPASSLEAIRPTGNLELQSIHCRPLLELGVSLSRDLLVQCHFRPDVEPLQLNSRVCRWQLSQLRQIEKSFLISALGSQPSGRERQKQDSNAEDEPRNDLNEERQSPSPLAAHVVRSICDPESNDDASDNAKLLKHEQRTSDLWRRDLTDEERRDHGEHTNAETADESRHDEHRVIHSGGLQSRSDREDYDGHDDGVFARELVGDPTLVESADESAEFDLPSLRSVQ